MWEIVGGADKGGILVREGQALGSPATKDRLSTGATIEQIELVGERLHYKLVEGTGTGPAEGWVSLTVAGKDLVVPKEPEGAEAAGPGEPGPVEVDEALKAKIEADSKTLQDKFLLYCMKYKVLGCPLPDPKLRILCFHNAGGAESNYTTPNMPLAQWAKESKQVEVMAFDFPGRDKLNKEPFHTSIETLAPELLAVAYEKLVDGVPYIVWAHSVGTWVAFEFLVLCRKAGLPMPVAGFFNAFPAPHMPTKMRPWHKSQKLNDAAMREELLNWDRGHLGPDGAGKVVFDMPGWKDTWGPMMRADFQLFDEYSFKHSGAPKFEFPIHSWHMEKEHYNKPEMIEMWKDWTSAEFDFEIMKDMGHLTCFYKPDLKKAYFNKVIDLIKKHSGLS